MAREEALQLHSLITDLSLSSDLHEILNALIAQHLECPNCGALELLLRKEAQRMRSKCKRRLKRMRRDIEVEYRERYRIEINNRTMSHQEHERKLQNGDGHRSVIVNETVNDLDIDSLYRKRNGDGNLKYLNDEQDTDLMTLHNDIGSKSKKQNNKRLAALIAAKMATNLSCYYQV